MLLRENSSLPLLVEDFNLIFLYFFMDTFLLILLCYALITNLQTRAWSRLTPAFQFIRLEWIHTIQLLLGNWYRTGKGTPTATQNVMGSHHGIFRYIFGRYGYDSCWDRYRFGP